MRDERNGISPEVNILSIRDATLYTTTPVRLGTQTAVFASDKGVIVLASGDFGAFETRADFESFGGGDGEHGVCQCRFELVKDGLPETRWDVTDDAGNGTADGV